MAAFPTFLEKFIAAMDAAIEEWVVVEPDAFMVLTVGTWKKVREFMREATPTIYVAYSTS